MLCDVSNALTMKRNKVYDLMFHLYFLQ